MPGFGIGQPIRRVEDKRFLTGHGTYVEDINLPRQAYAVQVLSPHAHAKLGGIDKKAAEAAPGVLCVLTGADAGAEHVGPMFPLMPEDMGGPKGFRAPRFLLATGKVRYVGERVAFVVAETLAQALDAAELVSVSYDPLPALIDPEEAVKDGSIKIWDDCPTGNIVFPIMMGNKETTDAAFAQAAHKVTLRLVNNRLSANSMETRGYIGDYDGAEDFYTLYTTTQNPHGARGTIAGQVFHVPESQVRVIAKDVGGGFGMKGDVYPEEALVLWASKKIGRPVKWISSRSEGLLTDTHGRDQIVTGEIALDKDGKILGLRAHSITTLGGNISGAGVIPSLSALQMAPQVYRIPTVFFTGQAVFTNTTPLGPYRGAGRPEATYFMERMIEHAARVTGIDPVEIRRRNFIPSSAMPFTTATGVTYDSGDFADTMAKTMARADWNGYAARKAASEKRGKLRGRGLIYYVETCGIFNDRMELRFDPSGSVTVVAGTFSHGQGHATTYAQMVSEWLGVPFESIRFVQGDTNQVSFGRGTYGSRTSSVGGGALKAATANLIEKAKQLASHLMEAAPADIQFENGRFTIVGTDKSMGLLDVAKAAYAPMFLPPGFGVGLEASGAADGIPNFPNGCHICELEVDADTGVVTIDRYTVVDDVGMVINPLIVEGQIIGGLAQGFGQALLENIEYDGESGQLLTGSFSDYTMPRADDMPSFECGFNNVPCKTNALGIKGAGEAGSVGAPPAVINALVDALAPLGVKTIDMPATPKRVWETIAAARKAA
jgi:aerobic carbon-monoxide dehydrogenase large subunit